MIKGSHLLIVDDDVDLASNLRDILEDEGYRVSLAHDAQAAISLSSEQTFSLVISDLKLPDIFGVNLIEQLSQIDPQLESIIVTGYASLDTAVDAVAHRSIVAYETKPLDMDSFLALIRQVIERRQAQNALQESEEKYRSLINHIPDIVWMADSAGTMEFVSPNVETILGYTPEELLSESVPFFLGSIHPEDREKTISAFTSLAEAENLFDVEFRIKSKSGEWVWLHSRAMRTIEKDGVRYFSGLASDMTARRETEDKLLRQNRELVALNRIATVSTQSLDLRQILDNTLFQVLDVAGMEAGIIALVHERGDLAIEATHGLPQAVKGTVLAEKVDDGLMGTIIRTGLPVFLDDITKDARVLKKGMLKRERIKAFGGVPLKARDAILGVLGVMSREEKVLSASDMRLLETIGGQLGIVIENAQLFRAAAEVAVLRELDRLRGQLLSTVSHELRTPLTAIKGYSTMLLDYGDRLESDEKNQFLKAIDRSSDRLTDLIEQLLDMSRLESGTLKIEKSPVEISGLVEAIVAESQIRIMDHPISLTVEDSLPLVHIDPKRIRQVVENFIDNAVKYSKPETKVVVSVAKVGDEIHVSVADEGIGIAPEDFSKVFDRMYRVETPLTSKVGGIGLGLSICKGIVEAHGGRIWLESKERKGSAFYFSIPLDTEETIVGGQLDGLESA